MHASIIPMNVISCDYGVILTPPCWFTNILWYF